MLGLVLPTQGGVSGHICHGVAPTHDSGMPTDADTRASSMRYSAIAVVVELLRNIRKTVACSDCRLVCIVVHGELCQLLEVKHQRPIGTSQT